MGSVVEEKTLVVKTGGEVPAQRRQDPVFRLNFASQHAPQVGEADEALQKMNLPVEMLDSPDDRKQRPVRAVAEKARAFPEQLGDEPEQMQAEVAAIPVPDAANELADDILCQLRKDGVPVSDRKYLNYYPIAQAKAWLSGHSQVESQDLLALKNYLWQKPGDRPGVETVLERMCVNPMQDKVNGIRAMAVDVRTEFDAAISDASKPNAGSKALIKLRGELVRLYNEQQKLAASVQSDGEKALTDGLLADMEQINRKAHEAVGFTYTPLEQLAALQ